MTQNGRSNATHRQPKAPTEQIADQALAKSVGRRSHAAQGLKIGS
jgi:hypothetical protein